MIDNCTGKLRNMLLEEGHGGIDGTLEVGLCSDARVELKDQFSNLGSLEFAHGIGEFELKLAKDRDCMRNTLVGLLNFFVKEYDFKWTTNSGAKGCLCAVIKLWKEHYERLLAVELDDVGEVLLRSQDDSLI